jgi:hypothetical protein
VPIEKKSIKRGKKVPVIYVWDFVPIETSLGQYEHGFKGDLFLG